MSKKKEKKSKLKEVLLALEKIARKTGEDEDDYIWSLENEYNIKVTEVETKTNRFGSTALWVVLPISCVLHLPIGRDIRDKNMPLENAETIMKKIEKDGKNFVKYAYPIGITSISDTIFEILKNQYGIMENFLTPEEWGKVYDSEEWVNAKLQIGRELIAEEIYFKLY
ncbi:MAG: hypothetical protein ACFFCV_07040 [Promethearchaeota archaeon]